MRAHFLAQAIFISILGTANLSQAKESWIQVTGINQSSQSQNLTDFYVNSAAFSKACKQKAGRSCEKFINADASFAIQVDKVVKTGFDGADNLGAPTKQQVLDHLKKKVSEAKSGDQVLIALENHGSPAPANVSGKSCVWINASECISEEDIREVLKSRAAGVRVGIVADACYSGAFGDVSDANTCALTAKDQQQVGVVGSLNLWNRIASGQFKKMSDFSGLGGVDRSFARLGSENMRSNNCSDIRAQISKQFTKEERGEQIAALAAMANVSDICSNSNRGSQLLAVANLKNQMTTAKIAVLEKWVCEKYGSNSAYCKELSEVVSSASAQMDLFKDSFTQESMGDLKNEAAEMMKVMSNLPSGIDMAVFQHLKHLLQPQVDADVNLQIYSDAEQKIIRESSQKLDTIFGKFAKVREKLEAQFQQLEKKVDPKGSSQIASLQRCLLDPDKEMGTNTSMVLSTFTEKQITEAKKCEDSFSF